MSNGIVATLAVTAMWVIVYTVIIALNIRAKLRAKRLKVGATYVIDAKDPWGSTKAVISGMQDGYVQYQWVIKVDGKESLSSPQSAKATTFAGMYQELKEVEAKP